MFIFFSTKKTAIIRYIIMLKNERYLQFHIFAKMTKNSIFCKAHSDSLNRKHLSTCYVEPFREGNIVPIKSLFSRHLYENRAKGNSLRKSFFCTIVFRMYLFISLSTDLY